MGRPVEVQKVITVYHSQYPSTGEAAYGKKTLAAEDQHVGGRHLLDGIEQPGRGKKTIK